MRQKIRVKWSLLTVVATVLLLFVALITTFSVSAHGGYDNQGMVVKTMNGKVKGTYSDGARVFRGIPYAAPPVGELRWKAPTDNASWSGVRDATQFASTCAAPALPEQVGIPSQTGSTNEDCLYLNVYTPKKVKHDMPVMVFIHGGGFMVGGGSDHEAEALAKKGDAVVVTINYRLGVFGFLALSELTAENGTSGNLGMQDQQQALQWVQANIAQFGGNKDNVTLFGISAGGRSICEHLLAPGSAGLFDRAVIQSSACVRPVKSLATAEGQGVGIAENAGCDNAATRVDCLRGKTTEEMLDAAGFNISLWGPNVDGTVIPEDFSTAINDGNFHKVPVMEGTTSLEYLWHVTFGFDGVGSPVTVAQYPVLVGSLFGEADKATILAQYPLSDYASPSLALANLVTDANYSCATRQTSQLLAQHVPVYQYEFADENAPDYLWQGLRGPVHASETNYLFQPAGSVSSGYFTHDQYELSNKMIGYWTEFARSGNPNQWGQPYWPVFNNAGSVQRLAPSAIGASTTFAADHNCDFWESL